MVKASTKSQSQTKSKWETRTSATIVESDPQSIDNSNHGYTISTRTWRITSVLILAVAAFLRFYHLTLKPLHHDEGVNGFFLTRLVREGAYQYDPGNYHGPTIYYFALISTYIFGLNTVAIRVVTVMFGLATVCLALCLRRYIGSIGALVAASMIAISPGAVYLSRYFIHEMLVVFFTFAIVVAALKYYESEPPEVENRTAGLIALAAGTVLIATTFLAVYKPRFFRVEMLFVVVGTIVLVQALWAYDGRRSIYLLLLAMSAALLFASKETALVSVTVLILAFVSTRIYIRLRNKSASPSNKRKRKGKSRKAPTYESSFSRVFDRFGGPRHLAVLLFGALVVFVFVNVLFYSSFFTNGKGVSDSLQTFMFWAKTGKQEHVHSIDQHVVWLFWEESPILVLGIVGAVIAVVRANNRFALFAAQWAFGLLAAYSLVPYKTPWLVLNFIIPLAIVAGYAVNRIHSWNVNKNPVFVIALLIAAFGLSGYQTIRLNYFRYDDENYVYVYGHTYRTFLPMVDEINRIAQKTSLNNDLDIAVLSPDYWPLPWYLRDYTKIGYYGKSASTNSSLVIINLSQEAEELPSLVGRYVRVNTYPLRPGVVLVLYARNDLDIN